MSVEVKFGCRTQKHNIYNTLKMFFFFCLNCEQKRARADKDYWTAAAASGRPKGQKRDLQLSLLHQVSHMLMPDGPAIHPCL